MSNDFRYQRSPHVLWRRTLETVAVLAVDGDDPIVLAGTGADVWMLIVEPRTLDDLVTILSERYAGDPTVIASDVAQLLDTLTDAGLLISSAA